jgi:hypothetical protein
MATLLERYVGGEHSTVWEELRQLGPNVRGREVFEDALAVSKETVRRARQNFVTIIQRLDAMGYRFEDAENRADDAEQNLADLSNFAEAFEPQARAAVENFPVGGEAQASMQKLFAAFKGVQSMLSGAQKSATTKPKAKPKKINDHTKDPNILAPPRKNIVDQLTKFEKKLGGPMPLILRAWYEDIGSVYLLGSHAQLCPAPERAMSGGIVFGAIDIKKAMKEAQEQDDFSADPFAMYPFDPEELDGFREMADPNRRRNYAEKRLREHDADAEKMRQDLKDQPDICETVQQAYAKAREKYVADLAAAEKPMSFQMTLGPDDLTKAGISGDAYYVALPDPGADFTVLGVTGKPTFVEYLRRTFECGGFPGWFDQKERPAELAKLSEGLLPI